MVEIDCACWDWVRAANGSWVPECAPQAYCLAAPSLRLEAIPLIIFAAIVIIWFMSRGDKGEV